MIRGYVEVIAEVAATLEPGSEDITEREGWRSPLQ